MQFKPLGLSVFFSFFGEKDYASFLYHKMCIFISKCTDKWLTKRKLKKQLPDSGLSGKYPLNSAAAFFCHSSKLASDFKEQYVGKT